jgi:small nuclear ribonucleoprotein (snRNP)-like protein
MQKGIYGDENFMKHLMRIVGRHVSVTLCTREKCCGVLRTLSPKGDVVLTHAQMYKGDSVVCVRETQIIPLSSVVTVTAPGINNSRKTDVHHAVMTDADIGQVTSRSTQRELQPFGFEGDDSGLLGDSLDEGRWNSAEMLDVNEKRFGVTSTYSSDLIEYTTELKTSDTPEFLERQMHAEKLAREMENTNMYSTDVTEEDMFSAVSRPVQHSDQQSPPHTTPGVAPHTTPGVAPHTTPGVAPHTTPGVAPHTTPGVAPHTTPGVAPHTSPGVAPHTSPGVAPYTTLQNVHQSAGKEGIQINMDLKNVTIHSQHDNEPVVMATPCDVQTDGETTEEEGTTSGYVSSREASTPSSTAAVTTSGIGDSLTVQGNTPELTTHIEDQTKESGSTGSSKDILKTSTLNPLAQSFTPTFSTKDKGSPASTHFPSLGRGHGMQSRPRRTRDDLHQSPPYASPPHHPGVQMIPAPQTSPQGVVPVMYFPATTTNPYIVGRGQRPRPPGPGMHMMQGPNTLPYVMVPPTQNQMGFNPHH